MKRIKHTAALITAGLLCATGAVAQTEQATIDKALSPLPMDLRADATVYTYDDEGNRVTRKSAVITLNVSPLTMKVSPAADLFLSARDGSAGQIVCTGYGRR